MTIVVNATALRSSGGATILKQFVEAIPNDDSSYIIFVDESVQLKVLPNVRFVPLNKRSFFKRFLWDAFGVIKWLKVHNIVPDSTISLQNTNFRVNVRCPNYIYFHNPLSLFPFKWNVFKAKERGMWFYKHIYPFFVKIFINSRTEFFVQLNFIKNGFAQRFGIEERKIHVVFPKINIPNSEKKTLIIIDKQKINFFYPATPLIYKNHKILFEAFSIIDNSLSKKIVLYLTCKAQEELSSYCYKNIEIVYLGAIPHSEVIGLFQNADALLFPSYIETFGLPLIEAAFFGLPIIASDLPYAREVLDGYNGVIFTNHQDAQAWGDEILRLCTHPQEKFKPLTQKQTDSWSELFERLRR